jgi:glycosyltransferase involved in cell wall biosynthesis
VRLLITTQKIDAKDPVLGFFCRWVEEFAKHFEQITVVCLEKGEYSLSGNAAVYSLGKEKYKIQNTKYKIFDRLIYIFRFKKMFWNMREEYDAVFVHMNPEYMLIGGLIWKILGKRAALWYNHPAWNWRVSIASKLADKVFYTSPQASTARLAKSVQMPAGIDTKQFRNLHEVGLHANIRKSDFTILSLGRISKYKRIHTMLDALEMLQERGIKFSAHFYGNKIAEESEYYQNMCGKMRKLEDAGVLTYALGIAHDKLPELYNNCDVFINASQAGNLDKTILEAMACETAVLTCNPALKDALPPDCYFREDDAEDLAQKLTALLAMSSAEREDIGRKLRQYVVETHQLQELAKKLADSYP